MVAGIELEKYTTGYEILNQQSKNQSFPTQTWIALAEPVANNFAASLFRTAQSLSKTSLDPARLYIAAPKLRFLHSCLCCRDLGSLAPNDKHSLEFGRTIVAICFYNFNRGTLASGKTRAAPKTSKTTHYIVSSWENSSLRAAESLSKTISGPASS